MNIHDVLRSGVERLQGSRTGRRDAELLLMAALSCDRASLLTHPDRPVSNDERARYDKMIERRASFEPVQYILGEQEFFGLRFDVNPAVLIPRPETEHLVEALLARVPHDAPLRIADVGTGSGAIAVAIAHTLPLAQLTALDISAEALAVAQRNAERHYVAERIVFVESDLLDAVRGDPLFDAIVSNPPYVAHSEQLEAQVQDYEPHEALFAGPTGLEIYERLIPQAQASINPGGWLLLEIGSGQQRAVERLLSAWCDVSFMPDLQGIPRVAVARVAASSERSAVRL